MGSPLRRRGSNRIARFESMEPRLFLSGDACADFWIDYYVEDHTAQIAYPALTDAHQMTGLADARAEYGLSGDGQTVAVIDTGIAYEHYALGGGFGTGYRVVGGYDFTDERDADPYDDGPAGSHGTHVAGIIGSSDDADPGVAPGVDLVALRVFDDAGLGSFDRVEEALQWVHDNRLAFENPITTVNLSLGTHSNLDAVPQWATLEDELAQLQADGIFIAVAAGNGFAASGEPGLCYPAVSTHVVPVASLDADATLSYYSQRAEGVLAAPGRSIRSTVPDYLGDRNGLDDDFVQYSGTSMASPYVAGASVLLREACQFAGLEQIDQQMLYELMVSTADTICDPATGVNYYRLDLDAALDAAMPADEFGSTAAAAYDLGDFGETTSLSGSIAQLGDQDWFSFTATVSGSVTFQVAATGEMQARWETAAAVPNTATAEGDLLSFSVTAGQSYAVGLATSAALGHYTLEVSIEPAAAETDWGTVRQGTFDGYQIDADGRQFTLTAAADGLLSVEAFFAHADGDVDLELFDAAGRLLGASYSSSDYERIDVAAAAGDSFTLRASTYGGGVNHAVDFRATNLVRQDGQNVYVSGTAGDDVFSFAAGTRHQIEINGVEYQFAAAAVQSITFNGGAGNDSAVLFDSPGDELFITAPGYGGMFGPGFKVQAFDCQQITAYAAAGDDTARLYDSAGDDTFVATPGYAGMFAADSANHVHGFDTVVAFATAGGHDSARFYDSPGDDTFDANPIEAVLCGTGFYNRAKFFEEVHAFATAGGHDVAWLYDSAENDAFYSNTVESAMFGAGFYNRAKFFEQLHAESIGGDDRAYLYDSSGDDHLQAAADRAWLAAGGAVEWLYGFEYVRAQGTGGGQNTAEIAAVDFLLELDGFNLI